MKSHIFHFLYCKTKTKDVYHVKKDANNRASLSLNTVPQMCSEQGYRLDPGYMCPCKHTDQLRGRSVKGVQT